MSSMQWYLPSKDVHWWCLAVFQWAFIQTPFVAPCVSQTGVAAVVGPDWAGWLVGFRVRVRCFFFSSEGSTLFFFLRRSLSSVWVDFLSLPSNTRSDARCPVPGNLAEH